MANKKFTELTQASAINETDIVATSQYSGGIWSSLKATILQIANKIVSGINYNTLDTTDKTIIGAINEAAQSGGSGGHTILDDNGTALTQEDNLQFVGVYSEDDSVNDTTKVNIMREMTQAQYDLLSADEKKGIIRITDKNYVCEASEVKFGSGNVEAEVEKKMDWVSNGVLGAKNLIPYPYANIDGYNNRGITFTYSGEGDITLNGTASTTQQPFFQYSNNITKNLIIESGQEYTLSVDRSDNRIWAIAYFKNLDGTTANVSSSAIYDDNTTRETTSDYVSLNYNTIIHSAVTFKINTAGKYIVQLDVRVSANSGTYTDAKAKSLLRLAEDTDNTWTPYAMTNKQLTDVVNAVPTTAGTYSLQAVRNADGTISYSWV